MKSMKVVASPRVCARLLLLFVLLLTASSAAAQKDWPSEGPPRPLRAHDAKFPPYALQTLPNGLQVLVVLHHAQPAVSMRLLIRAGSASDPRDRLGVAEITANLLKRGTTTKSAVELADAIDFIGGSIETGAGTDLSYLNTVVMKDSFDLAMGLLSEMARHPTFAQEELDRERQQILSGLQVSLEDPEYVANAVFDRLVYGFHPYGLPQTGTPDTINAITSADVRAFHRRYFAPNNAILAIVGDLTADEAFAEAKKIFGDWERRAVPPDASVNPPDPARRVVVINKPDAVQTEVRVGHIGVPRNHPDYMALDLAIRILGGEGSNRLHQVLRTERALTYGAQANLDTLKRSGDIEAETNTRTEATGEVLRLMVDEFWRLQRERVGERELADAKAYLAGNFPLTIETPDAIALQVLNVVFYELPVEQLQNFRERVNAVTVDDIQRVARAYLKPDRLSIVLVGNAKAFESQLKGVGFAKFERIDLDKLDLTAAGFKHEKAAIGGEARGRAASMVLAAYQPQRQPPSVAPIVPEEGAKAKALLDRVVAAKGGLEKLRAIRTIVAVTTITALTTQGPVEARSTTQLEYPNHVRVETTRPDGVQVQVYDGQHAWVRDPMGVHDVPGFMVRDLETSLKRDTLALLLAAEDGSLHPRVLPDVKDSSGKTFRALELSGPRLDPIVLYVDPDSGLISKQVYIAPTVDQPLIEERFTDYRPVDGVQVAATMTVVRSGEEVLRRHVTEIRFNTPLDPALFKRPAS